MRKRKNTEIHPKIKEALGFDASMRDTDFLKAWKKKTSQVCKPCWELKYCPYGPFVEQSPFLPSIRPSSVEHNDYMVKCLTSDTIGGVRELSKKEVASKKRILEILKEYPEFLLPEIFRDLEDEESIKEGVEKNLEFFEVYQTPNKDFEKYKVPFPLDRDDKKYRKELLSKLEDIPLTPDLKKRIKAKVDKLKQEIKTGVEDDRKPLDPVRRKFFEKCVSEFNVEDHPESIPKIISEASCNIFGHICPVVFVGESITETSERRRRGRYIPFKTKIRIVRRDNYTCQECSKHLNDDEVEFDHIIPVSKGGSTEEHNLRLTCFDCNRDKLDSIEI